MDFTEKTLHQEYKFRGKIMSARVDDIELPNGKHAYREVCEHVGGVGVLRLTKTATLCWYVSTGTRMARSSMRSRRARWITVRKTRSCAAAAN